MLSQYETPIQNIFKVFNAETKNTCNFASQRVNTGPFLPVTGGQGLAFTEINQ
jgi:hypothetical protein